MSTPSDSSDRRRGISGESVKAALIAQVDRRAEALVRLSHQIHENPELGHEEHFAHDLLTGVLEAEGVEVIRSAFGLDTAFVARAGEDGPVVAVLCEYDALPGLGHACGHNVIAAAGLGAGLAAAAVASHQGGRVAILGTPAEEGGGGKAILLERGAFDGVQAALMLHPAGAELTTMDSVAFQQVWVEYHGRSAHAAAGPHLGVNALDAVVLGYLGVAALRQHLRAAEKVHGIITAAGDAPNTIPDFAASRWYVRAPTLDEVAALRPRVLACLEAGARATGCRMEHDWKHPPYAHMIDNHPLLDAYCRNAARVGRRVQDPTATLRVAGSTDMGNVSHVVPAIHPLIEIAPADVPLHSADFAVHAASPEADRAVLDGAKVLAMTIADLWRDPGLLQSAQAAHEAAVRNRAGPLGS